MSVIIYNQETGSILGCLEISSAEFIFRQILRKRVENSHILCRDIMRMLCSPDASCCEYNVARGYLVGPYQGVP